MELPYEPFYKNCLDEWRAKADSFRYAFLRECYGMAKALGYYPEVDFSALKIAHAAWVAQCEVWEKRFMMPGSNGLEHTKVLSLLLYQLASVNWVTGLDVYDAARDGITYGGTNEEREESRKDLCGGHGTYLAFQFVVLLMNWFEDRRIDRLQEFEFRMTAALEHDIMVYLLSEKRDELAIYLIFHALYARDPTSEGVH